MKKIFIGLTMLFSYGILLGTNNPIAVLKKVSDSKKIELLIVEIDGPIQLFSKVVDTYELVEVNANSYREVKTGVLKHYYIGNNESEEVEYVISANFKKVAKKYFKDTPVLAKKIGKRGFRYENLPFMILYHNKLINNSGTLTVADVRQWRLLN